MGRNLMLHNSPLLNLVEPTRFERVSLRLQLSARPTQLRFHYLGRPTGFEPVSYIFTGWSFTLSYGRH